MIKILLIAIASLFLQGDLPYWSSRKPKPPLPNCNQYRLERVNSDGLISTFFEYTDCQGVVRQVSVEAPDPGRATIIDICSIVTPSLNQIPGPPMVPIQATATLVSTCDGTPIELCDSESRAEGKDEYPGVFNVNMGTGQGLVTVSYTMGDVPDKVVIKRENGAIVFDSGWRGSTAYQSQLNSGLAAMGAPPETIQGPGTGSLTFNKNFSDSQLRVEVYTSYWITGGSSWWVTVSCAN